MANIVVLDHVLRIILGKLVEGVIEVESIGSETASYSVDQLKHEVAPVLEQARFVESWQVNVGWVQIHEIRKQGIYFSNVDWHIYHCFPCSIVYLQNVYSCLVEVNYRVDGCSLLNISRAGIAADIRTLELLAGSQQNDLIL